MAPRSTLVPVVLLALASAARAGESPPEDGLELAENLPSNHPECSSEKGCIKCPADTYYWGLYNARHYCVHCPKGFQSSGCLDCKPDPYNESCRKIEDCPQGKFVGGNGKCEECSEGRWQSQVGQASCLSCPKGMFQPKKGMHSCYNCPVGTYGPTDDASSCQKCGSCSSGKYGTTAGDRRTSAADCTCLDCTSGKFSPSGYTTCFDCPTGRYQPHSAGSTCLNCPNGKYQPQKKATACHACEANSYTSKPGLKSCDKYFADYTVHFRIYDYTYASHLKAQGWHLMSYEDIALYKNLFQASYTQNGGLQALGKWQGAGCCLALAEGYRLTVDHDSYVYPMSDSGSMACSQASSHFDNHKYRLAFHTQEKFSDIATATSLSGAKGVGMCAQKPNENNPGIFMAKVKGAASDSTCAIVNKERLCLAPVSHQTPTTAPTASLEHAISTPEDCVVSEFSKWSACSQSCGGGSQHRRRKILSPPLNGGKPCPQEQEEWQVCQNVPCQTSSPTPEPSATDTAVVTMPPTKTPTTQPTTKPTAKQGCQVSDFGAWSSCSRSCGNGYSFRSRSVVVDGQLCPALHQFKACQMQACPINCQVTEFSEWQACSVTCGGGTQSRVRSVARASAFGGVACPNVRQSRDCYTENCPIDCAMNWLQWSPCSVSCGDGHQDKHRIVIVSASNGGQGCPADVTETKSCTEGPCPVHCQVSPFNAWSACSKSCSGGLQYRNRTVITHSQHGGYVCPELNQQRLCNEQRCPIDCEISVFGQWTACSQTCGTGFKLRSRSALTSPPYAFGGKPCPHVVETAECNAQSCAINCDVTEFAQWEDCSRSCGSGTRIRRRSIAHEALHGGLACPSLIQTGHCKTQKCPTDCAVSSYSGWSSCSKSCHQFSPGSQSRSRSVNVDVVFGGKPCPSLVDTRLCASNPCPLDCGMVQGVWSACSKTCGGHRSRTGLIHQHAAYGGKPCQQTVETEACGGECPEDCQVSPWGSFSPCTHTCGGGKKTRSRQVLTPAKHFGACPLLVEVRACSAQPCPIDCEMTPWSAWSDCGVKCGIGKRRQTRMPYVPPQFGGAICPGYEVQHESCDAGPCPVHCQVTGFGPWADCSKTCGGGVQSRTRLITTHAAHGGYTCPNLSETITCNSQPCPADCVVTEFSAWAGCSVSCGAGIQTRTRSVSKAALAGGKCPILQQQRTCNMFACPQDCVLYQQAASRVIDFYSGRWSACSKTCGSGSQTRTLSKFRAAQYGGKHCPLYKETRDCSVQPCPQDCVVSTFGGFTECSEPCGGGFKIRGRSIVHAASGGKACPALSEMKTCNTDQCMVHCEVSDFSAWSACSTSCGTGHQTKTRTVTETNKFGGSACPLLRATQHCNDVTCPADCIVTAFANWSPCTATCGGGTEVLTRSVSRPAGFGGKSCPSLSETRSCGNVPCPVDCVLTISSPWSECSQSCDGGLRTRTRTVVKQAAQGGKACPQQLTETVPCGQDSCALFRTCTMSAWGEFTPCTATCGNERRHRTRHVIKRHSPKSRCPSLYDFESCNLSPCPMDCKLSNFTDFGFCSRSCGTGQMNRYRSMVRIPAYGGVACGARFESKPCNTHACPADCKPSDFSEWSLCSKSCGGGSQTRTRSVNQAQFGGGRPCPAMNQTRECSQYNCPVDCIMSAWEPWHPCTRSCGGGRQLRARKTITFGSFGGKNCGLPHELRACGSFPCAIDCTVNAFGAWSVCSQTCGSGFQLRSRTITGDNAFGGRSCPELIETKECHGAPCKVNCLVSKYSEWSACSATCGFGLRKQMRVILAPAQHGGIDCPPLSNELDCNAGPCPVHCKVSDWEESTTPCSRSCGTGSITHKRIVLSHAKHGGYTCPILEMQKPCNSQPCPTDCVLSHFSKWGACTTSCGIGSQTRTRRHLSGPKFGGKACIGVLNEARLCTFVPCPIDCTLSEFGDWSDCSTSCGSGVRSRARAVLKNSLWGGKICPVATEESGCNTHSCPVNCVVENFSKWGDCSTTCGQGYQSRTRSIDRNAAFGGASCPALSETLSCNRKKCPANCLTTPFSSWTVCSASCGTGVQMRYRSIGREALFGGVGCPELSETQYCSEMPCPIDCAVAAFDKWSECSVSCGGQGTHMRERGITVAASHGGRACPALEEQASCSNGPCPVHCEVTPWKQWTICTASCGGGTHSRTRSVVSHAIFAGYSCPHLTEEEPCHTQPCATDCVVSAYGAWSSCSHSCGTGLQSRERTIQTQMTNNGKSCPTLTQERKCNSQICAVDCRIATWSTWGDCSLSCGTGYRSRTTSVLTHSSYGGQSCPVLFQHGACNTNSCPIDCVVSPFAPWKACSVTCGSGRQVKERRVVHAGQHGGSACPHLVAEQVCNDHTCPIDCTMTPYGAWGTCTHSCGTGSRTRSRSIAQAAAHGGLHCSGLTHSELCSEQPCPVDCRVSLFTSWTTCTKTCGSDGITKRTRQITQEALHGGVACPSVLQLQSCNDFHCPVHCEVAPFGLWTRCTKTCGNGLQHRSRTIITHGTHSGYTCPSLMETKACNEYDCGQSALSVVRGTALFDAPSNYVIATGSGDLLAASYKGYLLEGLSQYNLSPPEDTIITHIVSEPEFTVSFEVQINMAAENALVAAERTNLLTRAVVAVLGVRESAIRCNDLTDSRRLLSASSVNLATFQIQVDAQDLTGANTMYGIIHGDPFAPLLQQELSLEGWSAASITVIGVVLSTEPVRCSIEFTVTNPSFAASIKDALTSFHESTNSVFVNHHLGGITVDTTIHQNCAVAGWAAWGGCSVSCGTGVQTRSRAVATQPTDGGNPCPAVVDSMSCNSQPCPIDCVVSTFEVWGVCSRECGTGYHQRTRSISRNGEFGGVGCPVLSEHKQCNTQDCAIDCVVSEFSAPLECSKTCGTGTQQSFRSVLRKAAFAGQSCPSLQQVTLCNVEPCAEDCLVSPWGVWTDCSVSCGGEGKSSNSRTVVRQATAGGMQCPLLVRSKECNNGPCTPDCTVSAWSVWSTCTLSCGTGTRSRLRTIVHQVNNALCPFLADSQACNGVSCPVDCQVTTYGEWSICPRSCGGDYQRRSRTVSVAALVGGKRCPYLQQSRQCNTQDCPVDCVVTGYGEWSSCSASCGSGYKTRGRSASQKAVAGGESCPELSETASCNLQACPTDCSVTAWAAWGQCSGTCGGGTNTRTRTIASVAQSGGKICPVLKQSAACNGEACPVHCTVSVFGPWSECSKTCGGGVRVRIRKVVSHAESGGYVCPQLSDSGRCNTRNCPVNCAVSSWAEFGACSVTCGDHGIRERTRQVTRNSTFGGRSCPSLADSTSCTPVECPRLCEVSDFGPWLHCSKSCGGGQQVRSRVVLTHASRGFVCPSLTDMQRCNVHSCPTDCVLSEFSSWTSCSASCGSGFQTRSRSVAVAPMGGKSCSHTSETRWCSTAFCPVDCKVTAFGAWTSCSHSCGTSHRLRSRSVERNSASGGLQCPSLTEQGACDTTPCPQDCVVTKWSDWSPCTASCDATGIHQRSRNVRIPSLHGGQGCPVLSASEDCNNGPCPIHCEVSAFGTWDSCSKTCGAGIKSRSRTVQTHSMHGGYRCPELIETRPCNSQPCATDCQLSAFSAWGSCSRSCGSGNKLRSRSIVVNASNGGITCGSLTEDAKCNTHFCPTDCITSSFGAWGSCSKTCGTGFVSRSRSVQQHNTFGGHLCPVLGEVKRCAKTKCPVDCVVSEFSALGACSRSCDGGSRQKIRSVLVANAYGGTACPTLTHTEECNWHACSVDCQLSPWTDWSDCSLSCGGQGIRTRSRRQLVASSHGGISCADRGALVENMACENGPCGSHCEVGSWNEWNECAKTCGSGLQQRQRAITVHATAGGYTCPSLSQTRSCNSQACPTDCVMSEYGDWSFCTASCGTGSQIRFRHVVIPQGNGGKQCLPNQHERACNTQACSADCVVSQWSSFTSCSRSCGTGQTSRYRSVLQNSLFGGAGCPRLVMVQSCNARACPIDCEVGGYGDWGACSKSCGAGSAVRYRNIVRNVAYNGKECPSLSDYRVCNAQPCPLHCVVSSWSTWTDCSKTCGGGTKIQTRSRLTPSAYGGTACPILKRTQQCGVGPCPEHCDVSSWNGWSACSRSCGTGVQARGRSVTTQAKYGGYTCPALQSTRSCNPQNCPIDCLRSEYGPWELCTHSCGTGSQSRTRSVARASAFGGKPCGQLISSRQCNAHQCPIDCETSEWTAWTACTRSCGSGITSRTRSTDTTAAYGGKPCGSTVEHTSCNDVACPIDCVLGTYESWTPCSNSCGGGHKTRVRSVDQASAFAGKGCLSKSETQECNTQPCAEDCVVGAWGDWTACSATCKIGTQSSVRVVTSDSAFGGSNCPSLARTQSCSDGPCPMHCDVSTWSAWTGCSFSCGNGMQTRLRNIITHALHGGYSCPYLHESRTCEVTPCPLDCTVDAWGDWDTCSRSCGTGVQRRNRPVIQQPAFGGMKCAVLYDSRTCNTNNCPVDCIVSDFIDWTPCTSTCGGGMQERHRSVYRESMYGGETCPRLHEQQSCNTHGCPLDCEVSGWLEWSTCSLSCGAGQQVRNRTVTQSASLGGVICPTLQVTRSCNEQSCPIDCTVSDWDNWDGCTRSCGGGIEKRSRSVTRTHVFGGKICPKLYEARFCNTQPCAIDCVHSNFGSWKLCSASCGGGMQIRYRGVRQASAFSGQSCGALHEEQACNTQACPSDCAVGPFSRWGTCTKLCGEGTHTRERPVVSVANEGGKECPHLLESKRCNTFSCAIHCEVSTWGTWGVCTKSCGKGDQARSRSVTQSHAFGGAECPALSGSRSCNRQSCPVDCAATPFGEWSACSVTCGSGFSKRTRTADVDAGFGGKACPVMTETQSCYHHSCAQDCEVSTWGIWTDCSASCLKGTQARVRSTLTYPSHGGAVCPTKSQSRECDSGVCPIHCEVTAWGVWSACGKTCGSHVQQRARSVSRRAQHGGYVCPSLEQERECHIPACPVDCLMDDFSAWSVCSKSCGSPNGDGSQVRSRTVTRQPAKGGVACGSLQETQLCGTHACPSDCVVTKYGSWGPCSKSCSSGYQDRFRSIAREAYNGGQSCPLLTEARVCNSQLCPADCTVSAWKYGTCSVTCGGGSEVRTRSVINAAENGGRACPVLTATVFCETGPCPAECKVSTFGEWSSCSRSCGPGVQVRSRNITSHGSVGYTCPDLDEHRTCNDRVCPSDCLVAEWQTWSTCSASCGTGISTRSRSVTRHLQNGGAPCPSLHETTQCHTQACPVNCNLGDYGSWTVCNKECGSGTQQKKRSVVREPKFGGRKCPKLTKTRLCNVFPCGVDCVVSDYNSWSQCDKDCNGGIKRRSRNILSHSAFGGKACPPLVQSIACNEHCCKGYSSPVGSFCQACSPGTHQGSSGSGTMVRKCQLCAPGLYQNDAGQGSCKTCADGTFHHEWGRAMCLACEIGQYGSGDKHSIDYCKTCPSGTFANSSSSSACESCKSCPAGQIRKGCDGTQAGSCEACGHGTFKSEVLSWDSSCSSWSKCDAGHYKAGHNSSSDGDCQACSSGTYADSQNTKSSCTVCPKCPVGHLRSGCGHNSIGHCVPCHAGKFHSTNTETCEVCPIGKFNTEDGLESCKGCMEGRYGRGGQVGQQCIGCKAGKFGDTFGMTDSHQCKMCAAGRYGHKGATSSFCSGECPAGTHSEAGSTNCTKCGSGTYSLAGSGECSTCPAGRYGSHELTCQNPPCEVSSEVSVALTSSYCSGSCPSGRYSTGGSSDCTACTAGLFGLGGSTNAACSGKCPVGQYSNQGSGECHSCPAGQYQPVVGGTSCTSCPIGQHQPIDGEAACAFCEAGQSQNSTGMELCKSCTPGKFQSQDGQAECDACASGKYSTTTGAPTASRCWFCPSGKFGSVESATECSDCSASFGGLRSKHCVQCPTGTFQLRDGSDVCEECPSGKFKKTTAAGSSCRNCPADATLPSIRFYWTSNKAGQPQCRPRPLDCVAGEWGEWGVCSKTCGGGQQKRTRAPIYEAWGGGLACVLEETRNCAAAANLSPCPEDCAVESWSDWGGCSSKCGGGMQSRRRGALVAAAFGGKRCPALYEGRTCNPQQCSCSHVHCKLIPGSNHIRVFHHRREIFGDSHVCRYNGAAHKCECVCGNGITPASVDWHNELSRPNTQVQFAPSSTTGASLWHLPLWTPQSDRPTGLKNHWTLDQSAGEHVFQHNKFHEVPQDHE